MILFELGLVELVHAPKSCSPVEKVELFIIFLRFIQVLRFIQIFVGRRLQHRVRKVLRGRLAFFHEGVECISDALMNLLVPLRFLLNLAVY